MKILPDEIFIYPTDTVWGIGCSIYSQTGFNKIAEVKKTSTSKPLSIMFASTSDVFNSFHFPAEVTSEWIQTFFSLETTLGYPLDQAKIKIPKWATGDSQFVSFRCLENLLIKQIAHELKAPFFTTSLNLTGEPPITSEGDAVKFKEMFAPDAQIFLPSNKETLSGSSSSIVFLNENLNFEIKREGKRITEVKDHIMELFC